MDNETIDKLIQTHYGFILKSISDITGKYVSIENDDSLSIALLAFQEAYERYDEEKGPFLPYAKLVIRSRLYTYLKKENENKKIASLNEMEEGGQFVGEDSPLDNPLHLEIKAWQKELALFSISFDRLADHSPKHRDTKDRAISISEKSSEEEEITLFLYDKKRLPNRKISVLCNVTEKVVKGSKIFILAVIIVFLKKFEYLIQWIKR